jgi:hypothetical protein
MKGHSQLRKGRRSLTNQIYHVSSATVGRRPVFSAIGCGREVVHSFRREHEAGHVESLAFVVMPDHFHWLFALTSTRMLSVCINTVKSFSRREDDLIVVARYIIANPLRAGIVDSVRNYPLWDTKWL